MAEWSIAAVLKTVELRGSGGSNPSLSAKKEEGTRDGSFFSFLEKTQGLLNPTDGDSHGRERYSRWASAARSVSSNIPDKKNRGSFKIASIFLFSF